MSANGQIEDEDALQRALNARFRGPLMVFFGKRVPSRAEAEDLTQDTFVKLIGSGNFASVDEAQFFVFRVATNLLRDRCAR